MGETLRISFAQKIAVSGAVTASESLFPGTHLHDLGEYLCKSTRPKLPAFSRGRQHEDSLKLSSSTHGRFAALYDLHNPQQTTWLDSPSDLEAVVQGHGKCHLGSPPAAVLFLHGWPSPEWLNSIGELFSLDGSFIDRHLALLSGSHSQRVPKSEHVFLYRPNIFQVQLNSIIRISRNEYGSINPRRDFLPMLARHRSQFKAYQQSVRLEQSHNIGTSIVRNCTLHDTNTASVDQAVTISATPFKEGWISFIWSDVGSDIGEIMHQGWFGRDADQADFALSCQPTLIDPLNSNVWDWNSKVKISDRAGDQMFRKIPQNISHLANHYNGLIRPEAAVRHSFHAILGVLRLVRNSKSAYMDLLSRQIDEAVENNGDFIIVPEMLLITQNCLSSIADDLFAASHALENYQQHSWPTNGGQVSLTEGPDPEVLLLNQQYKDLRSRNEKLSKRCEQALHNTMSSAGIAESRKAITQAHSVEKLTRLAFVFIPLSFLSSFFGMNFKQLGMPGTLPIWVWFVIAVPTLLLSIFYTSSTVRNRLATAVPQLLKFKRRPDSHW